MFIVIDKIQIMSLQTEQTKISILQSLIILR